MSEVDDSERLTLPGEKPTKAKPVVPADQERKKIVREKEVCHMCNVERSEDSKEPPYMATLVCSYCYKHEDRPDIAKGKNVQKKDEAFYKARVEFISNFLNVEQERMAKEQSATSDDETKKIWQYKVDTVADVRRAIGEILA